MKKTGKALSLVLSLALVVSSLATTFASAATASQTATVSLTDTTPAYLSNGGTGSKLQSEDLTSKFAQTAELSDHSGVTLNLKEVVITAAVVLLH